MKRKMKTKKKLIHFLRLSEKLLELKDNMKLVSGKRPKSVAERENYDLNLKNAKRVYEDTKDIFGQLMEEVEIGTHQKRPFKDSGYQINSEYENRYSPNNEKFVIKKRFLEVRLVPTYLAFSKDSGKMVAIEESKLYSP